jgi:hypothetical protein
VKTWYLNDCKVMFRRLVRNLGVVVVRKKEEG